MLRIKKLQAATDLADVARLLKVKAGMLSYELYKKPKNDLYSKFEIAKRHGGIREISAPNGTLKLLQHRLSKLLQDCAEEINEAHGHSEDGVNPGIAHGFKRHHSTITNGRTHVTRRFVFNVDLQDFFGSINFGRVRAFFLKNKNFKLQPSVATVLAQVACFENKLPQGSPCSPVISNLIAHSMDVSLADLAERVGATYTRYADDLTFSSNRREFPKWIAVNSGDQRWQPGRELERIVARSGFSINEKKTRMQYRDSRQEVTGLTVNRKVNVPSTYRYRVRAMVDRLFRTGKFEFVHRKKTEEGEFLNITTGDPRQLLGMLSYIDYVDRFNRDLCIENEIAPVPTAGRVELFRRFLYFVNFYAANEPVIVCEGKTDNVYLRCAIKSLAAAYPELAKAGAKPELKVRFFKYFDRRASEITGITGGVGGICKLLKNYHEDLTDRFKAPLPKHPVIVMIDNDQGADAVYGAVAGITKKTKPAGFADFIHVTGNLYIVPTPFGASKAQTAIEDFFYASTLAVELNGKKFSRKKDTDDASHYGKSAFALNVVAKNASSINFKKFRRILDRFDKVILDYRKRLRST